MMLSSSGRAASENEDAPCGTPSAAGEAHHGVHRRDTVRSTAHAQVADNPRTELARRPQWQAAVDVDLDANRIRDAVAQLSHRHRAMIYRSHYLGRTTSEIAAELRTNDDVVKHELHHALHTLRMALDSAGEQPQR